MASDDDQTLGVHPGATAERTLYGEQLSRGALAGSYVIADKIGIGGCGTVYAAEHRVLGRRAAVKVLHRALAESADVVQRFVREARMVNQIQHPNVIDVFEFGELTDGRPFYVMELLEGQSLAQRNESRGRLPLADALPLVETICRTLDAVHDAGIIHRDLKASNIMISERDGARSVKLLDFGIAKLLRPDGAATGLTSIGVRLGTPHAMAPEQIRGEALDRRVDVYALGVLLFELLTGQLPFASNDVAELERMHLEKPAPRASSLAPLPVAVDAVVLRCLEKRADLRFATAGEVYGALVAAAARPSVSEARAGSGVAIFVELRTAPDGDEATLERIAEAIDIAESELRGAGYTIVVHAASSLLAARLTDGDAVASREQARLTAAAIMSGLSAAADWSVTLHAGDVQVRGQGATLRLVGGPLLRPATWAIAAAGIHSTAAFDACG